MRRRQAVVVVGAVLSGLVAAREIARAGDSVAVLEARDRVGGRMLDQPIAGGEVVDLGAEFIDLTQNRIRALVDAPWDAPGAAQLDSESLETWLRRNSPAGRRFIDVARAATRPIFGAEPRELSLLFVLSFVAASGDERTAGTFERNFNTRGGAQQDRIDGGTQQIAVALARGLGRCVIRRSPVAGS